MNPKRYSTFDEIDTDLKILNLQREIDRESLKLTYQSTTKNFYPTNLLGGFGGILQKLALSFVAGKLLKKFK